MKEDFLHYLWQFKKFDAVNLRTTSGEPVTIIDSGSYLQLSGPDFFNAQIIIGSQKWAGNIEIHLRSSDWYLHHHESDPAYDNVILHVVWEHDMDIFRKENSVLPVVELRHFTSIDLVENYRQLLFQKSWIHCEADFSAVGPHLRQNWLERMFFQRLERRAKAVEELLCDVNNDWEAVLFLQLASAFGLNTNGGAFLLMAHQIPFSVIRKESDELLNLEALFFGACNLLSVAHEDAYASELLRRRDYLFVKYNLAPEVPKPEFFKHRPDNFPTIRLAQLARLYHLRKNLFALLCDARSVTDFYEILRVGVSDYWTTHYLFDRPCRERSKLLSPAFINLLLLNAVLPILFSYRSKTGTDPVEMLVDLAMQLPPESNATIDRFEMIGFRASSSFETQALLEMKSEFCNRSRCLQCAIGVELMKPTEDGKLRTFTPTNATICR